MQAEYTRLKEAELSAGEPEQGGASEVPDKSSTDHCEQLAQIKTNMFDQVGGQAKYQALTSWAAENIGAERIAAYDEALQSADEGPNYAGSKEHSI